MITSEFKTWMIDVRGLDTVVARGRLSNCKKVWLSHGNLDQHYRRDEGKYILYLLTYSFADYKSGIEPKHGISIGGNKYTNTATYKRAAKLYMEFKEYQDLQKFSNI